MNFPTKPTPKNVEELVIQPSSLGTNKVLQPRFFIRNSLRHTHPLPAFVQEPPHQHHQFQEEDCEESDEEGLTIQA